MLHSDETPVVACAERCHGVALHLDVERSTAHATFFVAGSHEQERQAAGNNWDGMELRVHGARGGSRTDERERQAAGYRDQNRVHNGMGWSYVLHGGSIRACTMGCLG